VGFTHCSDNSWKQYTPLQGRANENNGRMRMTARMWPELSRWPFVSGINASREGVHKHCATKARVSFASKRRS